jgi:hypothetical protein
VLKLRCAWCGSTDNKDLNIIYPDYGELDISEEYTRVEVDLECSNCWKQTTTVYTIEKCFPKIEYKEFLKEYNREELIK